MGLWMLWVGIRAHSGDGVVRWEDVIGNIWRAPPDIMRGLYAIGNSGYE